MAGASRDHSPVTLFSVCGQLLAAVRPPRRANQERAPRSRRPGDREAGVSLRTPLAAVAVAARAPFALLPSSCNISTPRLQSPVASRLLLPA